MELKDKLTVLVGSCDNYRNLWDYFFTLYERYWKVDCEMVFVGETIPVGRDVVNVLPGNKPWGERILAGLEKVKTPYTCFLLEDYFFRVQVDQTFVEQQFALLEKYQAKKIMFDQAYPPHVYYLDPLEDNLFSFRQDSPYRNSCQPSIQETEYLKKIIKPEFTAWDLELTGNDYSSQLNEKLLLNVRDRIYFNFARQGGRIEDGGLEFLQSQGLKWN